MHGVGNSYCPHKVHMCTSNIITLFTSITMLYETEYEKYMGMFCGILLVSQNIVIDLNNVMIAIIWTPIFE